MPPRPYEAVFSELTRRHIEVLGALTVVLKQEHIAFILGVEVTTVRSHLRKLYELTGFHSMVELRDWWEEAGEEYLAYVAHVGRIKRRRWRADEGSA